MTSDDQTEPADGSAPEIAKAVTALTDEQTPPEGRRKLLGRLADQLRRRGLTRAFRPKAAVRWIADTVTEVTPHLPIRDLDTLSRHHKGLSGDELADRLVRNAARATAGIGAAGGGITAVEWIATPTLLSAPVLLVAETIAVVAVEIKLIGELHEVYGRPVPGKGAERTVALVQAWAQRRGVNPLAPGRGMAAALGTAARKELRDRLMRRFGRNLSTLGPLLTGAAVAGVLNRRATLSLAGEIRKDLTRQLDAGPAE
jgi:hypothetical protein